MTSGNFHVTMRVYNTAFGQSFLVWFCSLVVFGITDLGVVRMLLLFGVNRKRKPLGMVLLRVALRNRAEIGHAHRKKQGMGRDGRSTEWMMLSMHPGMGNGRRQRGGTAVILLALGGAG